MAGVGLVTSSARVRPFDETGIVRDAGGAAHFTGLPATVPDFLRAVCALVPEREAIVELGGARLTYQQLWDGSVRVAGGLHEAGVVAGERVALTMGNGIDWCLAFFGTMMAGAVAVPVNTRLAPVERTYVLRDSGASLALRTGQPLPDGRPYVADCITAESIACIIYTSGTTGAPKGAMLTFENLCVASEVVKRELGLPFGEVRSLIAAPLFHVMGSANQLLPTLWTGGTAVIMPSFDVNSWLDAISRERINQLVAVPAIYWQALRHPGFRPNDAVSWVGYGAAPTPPHEVARIAAGFPGARLGPGYGLTESGGSVCSLPHEYAISHSESVGLAAPGADLALLDPGSDGVAELLVRSPSVSVGYWQNPTATAEVFKAGWLHTGDLARIDDQGFVVIVDRLKDTVNRGGENVYCIEVENALASHPSVAEVAVVGVPDDMMGEKVGTVIVIRDGCRLSPEDVVSFAAPLLADFKVPQYVVIQAEPLPRGPGGKVSKAQLRDHCDWGHPLR
jgi:long-chain acyl-CoA synthetase